MDKREILRRVDHTLLKQDARLCHIEELCRDGIYCGCASVCIPPLYVAAAKSYCAGRIKVCTVIGFPNGYSTTEAKVFEAADAVGNGADELDMVLAVGRVKDGRYDEVLKEINAVKKACGGKILKVIVETCLLTAEEKARLARLVSESDADYIKTSTGFSSGGATREDIRIFSQNVSNGTKIKAAGGISSFADAEEFLRLGADRLGASRLVRLMKEERAQVAAPLP